MTVGIWGTGLIGRSLAFVLAEQGVPFCLLNRSSVKPVEIAGQLLPIRTLNFSASKAEIHAALDGLSVLVHCAGSADGDQTEYATAAAWLAEAAVKAGLKRVLMLSTVAVYGAALEDDESGPRTLVAKALKPVPITPYAQSRYWAETHLRECFDQSDISFVVVRVPMVLGVGMKAKLFVKLRRLLDLGLFPISSSRSASLPCIRMERLVQGLSGLALESKRLLPLYQFAEYLRWTTIKDSYEEATGRRVHALTIPAGFVKPVIRVLGHRGAGPALRVLLNEAVYQDDLRRLLAEAGPTSLDEFGHCRPNEIKPDSLLRSILWS